MISGRHIARSIRDEVTKMADTIIEEFVACKVKKPLHYEIALDKLENSASLPVYWTYSNSF